MSNNNVINVPATATATATAEGERWVSVKTAAEFFELSTRTVERLITRGDIPVLKIGRSNRVRISDILNAASFIEAVAS